MSTFKELMNIQLKFGIELSQEHMKEGLGDDSLGDLSSALQLGSEMAGILQSWGYDEIALMEDLAKLEWDDYSCEGVAPEIFKWAESKGLYTPY